MNKRSIFAAAVSALALLAANPALAGVVINSGAGGTTTLASVGNSGTINFNGYGGSVPAVIPGLSSSLTLTFQGIFGNTYRFAYSLTNSSTLAGTRVSSFGFNVNPNITSASATGAFDTANINVNYPVGFGTVEVCFYDGPGGTCTGNGRGVAFGTTGTGLLNLTFGGGAPANITLTDFVDRYQAFNYRGIGSAIGIPVGVPEPATWGLMILGIGLVGAAMRRQKQTVDAKINFA